MEIYDGAPLVYISFSAEINQVTTENFLCTLNYCASMNVKTVYILFSSPGGNVANGFNIYNVLRGMPYDTIMHNVGQVDSIGTLIFLGAKQRYMTDNSTFMFHGVGNNINQRLEEKDFRNYLNSALETQKRLSTEYIKASLLTTREVKSFFREAVTINAATSLAKGIVHEIRDVVIAPSCPIVTYIFNR